MTTDYTAALRAALDASGIDYVRKSSGGAKSEHLVVELPGERKLKTTVLLTAGTHGVRVEAFVCRRPDEAFEAVYKYLLKRNRRLYGVAYTLDNAGAIYLVGRISADSVTQEEVDRILGQVLEAADGDFNQILEIGFLTSIKREWAWRTARGEPMKNLEAFAHLIDPDDLPEIAPLEESGLDGIDEPTAGHLISAYAIGVVIGAPLIAVLAARMSRRTLLIVLMVGFTVGNALSLVAQSYGVLMAARLIAGLPHGAYFGVAALVAAHVAGPGRRAQAVGQVMLGLSVANVVGVPAATWLGQHFGWRAAIAMVVVIGVVTVAALWLVLPSLADMTTTDPRTELGGLLNRQIWLTLAVGMIGFGGFFAFYTYLNPALTSLGGLDEWVVPIALALFGLGMVTGNIVGGRLAVTLGVRAIAVGMIGAAAALCVFAAFVGTGWPGVIIAYLVGACGSLAIPGLQTRLMDVAHDAQTLAAALNHSALNVANAIGAWIGGVVIAAGLGYRAPSLVGAGLALGGALVLAVAVYARRRETPTVAAG